MKGLLDTHAFLWFDSEPARLSPAARAFCADRNNVLFVSVASVWELQIKVGYDKIDLRDPLAVIVRDQMQNGVTFLPVELAHVWALGGLPLHHKDPFDRVIIATAIAESATIISADTAFAAYQPAASVLW